MNLSSSTSNLIEVPSIKHHRNQRRKVSKMSTLKKPATASLLLALISFIIIVTQLALCTPSIDYFVYTSQLSTAQQGTQQVDSLLQPLKSIYNSSTKHESIDAHLDRLMSRVQSLVQLTNHSHDSSNIDLEAAQLAWHLMEKQAYLYMRNRVSAVAPFVQELLLEAQVSAGCSSAVASWLERLAQLDKWAAVMWNSWGQLPPAGVFEGSFTDLGSYSGCLNAEASAEVGEPKYCTLDYQPLVPARPRFHSIFKRVLDVDANSKLITGGDFDSAHSSAAVNASSRRSSHGVSSARFRRPKSISSDESAASTTDTNKAGWSLNSSTMTELARRAQFFYYLRFRLGSCWPSKCSQSDIESVAKAAGSRALLQNTAITCVTPTSRDQDKKLNSYQLVAVIVLGFLALLTVVASAIDVAMDLLLFFKFQDLARTISYHCETYVDISSLKRNCKRLFSVSRSLSMTAVTSTTTLGDSKQQQFSMPQQLTCLHGLKIISMIWVIYGHTLLVIDYQSFTHVFSILDNDLGSLVMLPFLNANFSVDTFFVISGLLSAYIIFSIDIKFNGFLYTMARYIRLTPQLAIVILMFFLLPILGDGPLYKQSTEVHAQNCYKNYWLDLLYLQIYVNRDEPCVIPSWWLSTEMTFHFLSLIVIYVLMKNPKLGMLTNLGLISTLTLIGSYIHYTNGFAIQYLPSIPQRYEVELEQTQLFFHRPYPHAASYFIGVGLGYLIARRSVKKLSSRQLMLGWSVFGLGVGVSLFGTYYWNQGAAYTQLQATLYYNLCQILWPMSIAWLILACSLGYGGVINELLSANFFVPFSRITYMTYLSHMVVVYYYAASIHQSLEPNFINLLYLCISNTLLSLVFGAICSLFYEAPMLNLQKLLLRRMYSRVDNNILGSVEENNKLNNHLIIKS